MNQSFKTPPWDGQLLENKKKIVLIIKETV